MILTVFRSRLRPEAQAEHRELAPQMSKLARSMPGYKSHKVFIAEDGERLTLHRGWRTVVVRAVRLHGADGSDAAR